VRKAPSKLKRTPAGAGAKPNADSARVSSIRADPQRDREAQRPGKPAGEQPDRQLAHGAVALGEHEPRLLVVLVEALEGGQALRDVGDRHALANRAPEVQQGLAFAGRRRAIAVAIDPADRLEQERGEHVQVVVVLDGEARVDLVHAPEHLATARRVIPVLDDLAHDDLGVVVALLRAALELARSAEDAGDRRHAEGAKQRELQRAL
jgi:hypothetical protein